MLYGGTAVLFAGYAAPVSGGGGECVRRFGDRDDGHLLRSLSCIFAVSPYLMKTRNIAQNYIRDAVEIARAEQDITQKRAAGMEHFGLLHVRLAVYVRTDLCPGPGDRGQHDRQKGDVPGHGHQAPVRPIGHGGRGLSAVQCQSPGGEERLGGHLLRRAGRRVPSGAGSAAEILGVGPAGQRLLRLPAQLHHPSLALPRVAVHYLHGASLGIPPIFHHLYDFGNVPVFWSFGRKRQAFEYQWDGTVARRR